MFDEDLTVDRNTCHFRFLHVHLQPQLIIWEFMFFFISGILCLLLHYGQESTTPRTLLGVLYSFANLGSSWVLQLLWRHCHRRGVFELEKDAAFAKDGVLSMGPGF